VSEFKCPRTQWNQKREHNYGTCGHQKTKMVLRSRSKLEAVITSDRNKIFVDFQKQHACFRGRRK